MPPIAAVLIDFAGTLLVPEPRESWVAAVRPDLSPAEVADLAERLDRAGRSGGPEPDVLPDELRSAYGERDLSTARHREVYEGLMAGVTGAGTDLTRRLYERGREADGWAVYPDAQPTLAALRERGLPVAVVSNAGFDLRPLFAAHGLAPFIDAYVLSFEVGAVKPDAAIFRAACTALEVHPADALMVGDNPRADGAACDLGIRTLLLPYSPAGAPHGLRAILDLVTAAA
jgi:HAD superfamily hydrolase (TIGR01509 family)